MPLHLPPGRERLGLRAPLSSCCHQFATLSSGPAAWHGRSHLSPCGIPLSRPSAGFRRAAPGSKITGSPPFALIGMAHGD
ncbi:hypothetical protein SHJG_4118 [Streptomyces hygroscopicus subsp. jinggangensis 5008]|nr:hypothetical protein SHJG_4118 [Streptomyces hygroscopicus subsp. jinggangensis 5008]AGF63548.1 hypothetical protein SHJGH_3883 [Streptomyces hygroscopicus subsp. jinggangensis TL01]